MQANRNGYSKVFAARGTRNVQVVLPNEKEHISILTAIAPSGDTIPKFYISKGMRARKRYIALCEEGATIGMQKKGLDGFSPFCTMDGPFYQCNDKKVRLLTYAKAPNGA